VFQTLRCDQSKFCARHARRPDRGRLGERAVAASAADRRGAGGFGGPAAGRLANGSAYAVGELALGAGVSNAEVSALLLGVGVGVGVGAIIQVIVQITPSLHGRDRTSVDPVVLGGIGVGIMLMYLTGLVVPA